MFTSHTPGFVSEIRKCCDVSKLAIKSSFGKRSDWVRGFLSLFLPGARDFRTFWCEFVEGMFVYRNSVEENRFIEEIRVGFATVDGFEVSKFDETVLKENKFAPSSTLHDFEKSKVTCQKTCFIIYGVNSFSVDEIILCRADDESTRDLFVTGIRGELHASLSSHDFKFKLDGTKIMAPLIRDQFSSDSFHSYIHKLNSDPTSGFKMQPSPILSLKKLKAGVLLVSDRALPDSFTENFVVLFESVLYFYVGSQAETPRGFVVLRNVAMSIEISELSKEIFGFKLMTPLRTIILRSKHEVAVADWMVAISSRCYSLYLSSKCLDCNEQPCICGRVKVSLEEKVEEESFTDKILNWVSPKKDELKVEVLSSMVRRKSSVAVVGEILKLKGCSIESVLLNKDARKLFSEFLYKPGTSKECTNLELYEMILEYETADSSRKPNIATTIIQLSEDTSLFTPLLVATVSQRSNKGSTHLFDQMKDCLVKQLSTLLQTIKASACDETNECYEEACRFLDKMDTLVNRQPDASPDLFQAGSKLNLVIEEGKDCTFREILLSGSEVVTIGRDHSNMISLEDKKVSRCHGRIEYNGVMAEYFDLGSSHGSLLNGKTTSICRLRNGDILTIGNSKITAQIVFNNK